MLATWPQIDPVRTSYFSDLFLLRKYFSRPKNYRRTGSAKLNGGGVLLYIRDNIPFPVNNELAANNEELLWIEINRPKCKPLLIAAIYKPPNVKEANFLESLSNCSAKIDLDENGLVLMGDFNNDQPREKFRKQIDEVVCRCK